MVSTALKQIAGRAGRRPKAAIVLGTGLGGFAEELTGTTEIPYTEIEGWPPSTVEGHAGKLIFGEVGDLPIAVMSGRAHLYEGYTPAQVVFGVRALVGMGARTVILTNAAGGINLSFQRGALVMISDHVNLQGSNPLVGPNDDSLGPRFPEMSEAYSTRLRMIAREAAAEVGVHLYEGVYAAVLGPSYETPAEIRFLRAIGADLVGMSTAAETIAARHMGAEVLGLSCVANMAAGLQFEKVSHQAVLESAARVRETLFRLLKALLPRLEF